MLQFEWDPSKAESNVEKHGVTFQEAATVFGDPDHSDEELRFLTIVLAATAELLIVAHVERGSKVRIISARTLTNQERKFYEGG